MEVKIGDYRMSEFGLQLLSIDFGTPEVKTESLDIPGYNGVMDYTDTITGYPTYKNVKHVLKFDFKDGSYPKWLSRAGEIKRKLHGKRMPVILGNDTYYYDARISVNTEKINLYFSQIEIELDAQPYKINNYTTMDDWRWSSFNFETDIIQKTSDIIVPAAVRLFADPMPTTCIFHCSQAMQVTFKGQTYQLPQGSSSTPDILILDGWNEFQFSGPGTVSIEYRGGRF